MGWVKEMVFKIVLQIGINKSEKHLMDINTINDPLNYNEHIHIQ